MRLPIRSGEAIPLETNPDSLGDFMKTLAALFASFAVSTLAQAAPATWGSTYTDLKADCVIVSQATDKAPIDFFSSECKSFGGYRLQETGSDLRYGPALSLNGNDLEIGRPGSFHEMDSTKVEWMYTVSRDEEGSGEIEWKGFIYRLSVDNSEGTGSSSNLFVVRLDGEKTCFLGNAKTNEAARALVKNAKATCQR
jgi:hypothetical protein